MQRLNFLDISNWNTIGLENYARINQENIAGVYVKCTEGINYFSPNFYEQYDHVGRTGAFRGAYMFFKPYQDADMQADLMINVLSKMWQPGDLPPMVDIEDPDFAKLPTPDHVKKVGIILKKLEAKFGLKAIIYAGYYYWLPALGNTQAYSGNPLMVASYTQAMPKPYGGWVRIDGSLKALIWQYAGEKNWQGIKTSCIGCSPIDMSWFYGSAADLFALAGITAFKPMVIPNTMQPKAVAIQARLNQIGNQFAPLKTDGFWGAKTTERLNEWQQNNGFPIVNEVGPDAWMKLFGMQYV